MRKFTCFCFIFAFSLVFSISSSAEKPTENMVFIKGGCFTMGTDKTYYYELGRENIREKPTHKVCLDSFYMDKFETTQKQWEGLMGYNNSAIKQTDKPVTHIIWNEAKRYCSMRGARLPTEAEWEYAARAGSKADYPWGNEIDGDYLWYVGNSTRNLWPVGQKKPNAWGLFDMLGSAWEWVEDWYSENYYRHSPVQNPSGPTRTSWHVIRGGSWVDDEDVIRVTVRYRGMADPTTDFWVGVRCSFTPREK